MLTVAYLANEFPVPVEPYVTQEVAALRRLGVRVVTGTVARAGKEDEIGSTPEIILRPVQGMTLARAAWLCIRRWGRISGLVARVLFLGREGPMRRAKALLHTLLGACYAVRLEEPDIDHIHVHHGFSASWIAMIAARLLGVEFSVTLHGSDLLLHRSYLDVKLQNCKFCVTVSEFNRQFIAKHYPEIEPHKVLLSRLGVEVPDAGNLNADPCDRNEPFRMLAVGRLHAVKNHAFLIRACAELQAQGLDFTCEIAGDGPEKLRLESLIRQLKLAKRIILCGHTTPNQTDSLYAQADLVVLTSRSEGIPLALMEAMARGKLVLAPAITGIPELVISGKTGFLYEPGSMKDFVGQVSEIGSFLRNGLAPEQQLSEEAHRRTVLPRARQAAARSQLAWIRHSARIHVLHNFNRSKNLQKFTDLFLQRVSSVQSKDVPHANSLLQQI